MTCFEPAGWRLFRVSGPDAIDFLHRITTVDVAGLGVGGGGFGCILQATGRISEWFHLTRLEGQALVATPTGGSLSEALERVRFREDLEISEVAGRKVIFGWSGPLVGMQLVETAVAPIGEQAFSDLRVLECFPWFPNELSGGITPPEASAMFAVSRDKGCYPGQEVVEKMLSGRLPRKLVRLTREEQASAMPEAIHVTTRHSGDGSALALVRQLRR